jgi:hypothetical protein
VTESTKPAPEPDLPPDDPAPDAVPGVVSPFAEAGDRTTLVDRVRDAVASGEVTPATEPDADPAPVEDPDAGSDPS